jgi:tetratricopeptide (TPR) repeat protein
MKLRTARWTAFALSCALFALGTPLAAQGRFGDEETRLIRQAGAQESAGDLDGAEQSLRRLLEIDPTSTGGLYGLERVLRQKGDVGSLLPLVDDFLRRREDSGIRSLKLQLLAEADSLDTLVDQAEFWIARSPEDETAYAEVARAYEVAFGHERALQVLESGRERLGGDALALAIGDHYAADGDLDSAVDEWAKAIGPNGSNVPTVRRRIQALSEGEVGAGRRMVTNLAESEDPLRRRAGIRIAIELGIADLALEYGEREVDQLEGNDRQAYLQELSTAATAAGVAQVASWAYAELSREESNPIQRRVMVQRQGEAALAAGDTVGALRSFSRVARALPERSQDRRQIEARIIRVAAAAQDIELLEETWAHFSEAYDDSMEVDALAATTAAALFGYGDIEGAIEVLDGQDGPRAGVERAYLLMGAGEIQAGQNTLMQAIPSLPPSEATEVIQLASLLGRVSPDGAQALANAGVQAHVGRGSAAARTLADLTFGLPEGDRPLLLAEAARIADRAGDGNAAAQIREQLVEEYPNAPQSGEAAIALARHLVRVEGNATEAIRILEDLITRNPGAAVVPEARLELERLRS